MTKGEVVSNTTSPFLFTKEREDKRMKKLIFIITIIIGLLTPILFLGQADIQYVYRITKVFVRVDSTTSRDTTAVSAIPLIHGAGKLIIFAKIDTVFKSGGTTPRIRTLVQFSDSSAYASYADKFNTTGLRFAPDTAFDTLKVGSWVYKDISSIRIPAAFMRIITVETVTDNKDTVKVNYHIVQE